MLRDCFNVSMRSQSGAWERGKSWSLGTRAMINGKEAKYIVGTYLHYV
jgi:hypothetical protein